MAEKEIVEVEVKTKESGTDEAGEKFVKLQTRIREARIELQKAAEAGDQLQFDKAKQELDDLNDELEATTLRSKNFAEILGQLPGPLGNVASQAGGAVDQLKAFSKLTFTDLANSFREFGKDLNDGILAIGRITGITKVYTVINNFLAASFTRLGIAEGAATAGARAFATALTATGIGAIVVGIGALVIAFQQLANAEENAELAAKNYADALQRQKQALDDLISRRNTASDIEIARLQQLGATDDQINKKRLSNAEANLVLRKQDVQFLNEDYTNTVNKLEKLENESAVRRSFRLSDERIELRKNRDELKKQLDTAIAEEEKALLDLENLKAEIAEEARNKANTVATEAAERRKKDLADIKENSRQARLVVLTDREREIAEINFKYDQQVLLAKAYKKDITDLEIARRAEIADVNKKFDDQDEKDRKEKADKALKEYKESLQDEFDILKSQLELRNQFGIISEAQYQEALFALKAQYAEKDKDLRDAELDGIKFFLDKAKDYGKQQEDINEEITQSYLDLGDNIATVFSRTAILFEQGTAASKAFGVLSVVANAASGIASSVIRNQEAQAAYNKTIAEGVAGVGSATLLLTNPITAALGAAQLVAAKAAIATATAGKAASATASKIQIGTIAATSALQIAAILGQKKSVSSAGGDTGGGGGGTIALGLGPTIGAPQVGAGAFNQQGQIAGIVAGTLAANQSLGQPIRAYVVGNDITTEQQLSRRIRTAARLGG